MPEFKLPIGKKSQTKAKGQAEHISDLIDLSIVMSVAVKKIFFEKSETKFTSDLIIKKKTITRFRSRMRVDAMEKFNQTTVFSVIHFYLNTEDMSAGEPVGLMIVYMERKFVPEILRLLKYPYIDYDEDDEVLDGAGAIANLIAGKFKQEIKKLGYVDLELSPFKSFINKTGSGVQFPVDQNDRFEISFDVDNVKRLVVEMVMTAIPKVYA